MTDSVTAPVSDPNPNNEESQIGNTSIIIPDSAPADGPAPKVEPPKTGPVLDTPVEYEPTGDVGLDMALAFMGKAGLGVEHPAMKAASNGDFTILKATLAAKGVQGWEQFVALGEAAFARTQENEKAKATQVAELVHKEAGGKEQWQAVQQWAAANATPEEKAQVNALLNQGGLAAKGAVQYLLGAYSRANNAVINPRDPAPNAGRGGNDSAVNGPLSPRAYADEVSRLNAKLGGRLEGSREYAALQQRRSAYRG